MVSLPGSPPYSPDLNANSPAATPTKSFSANSTTNTPVSPPEHPITSPPPQLSIASPPPQFSITSPPPENSITSSPPPQLDDVPTPPEISPPPSSANALPSSATRPKPTSPTTSPLPPSIPLVASPPGPLPLSPVSPRSTPTPTVRPLSAVLPRSTPPPTVTPPSTVSTKPPATRPPKPSETSKNSPAAPSPLPERSSPPDTRISPNVSLKVSPPPFPKFSLKVSPPPSINPTTNNPSSLKSTENAGIGTGGTVAIVLVFGLVLISLIGTAICCMRKRRRKFSGMNDDHIILTLLSFSPESDSALLKMQTCGTRSGSNMGSDIVYSPPTEFGRLGNSRSWFTYEELADATKGFSMQNLLGEGGSGCVYNGYLGDGREIAVKKLNVGGGQGEREFKAEVEIISSVHHRHLVSLVGYCISQNQRLLVYDYVPNNNLYFHLHGRPVMEWTKRVKVAAGAARGIAYLHEDCHPRIIHRDIKSSNILLDNSFEARVSDFGLAKLVLNANTHVTTRVIGTFGYMAPEYASSGLLTEKSDVYSFGVVLLELITGRKPVDASQPVGDESLVEWARPLLTVALANGNLKALADPGLGSNYVECEMFKIVEVAAACVRHTAAKRPRTGQVVREFDSMAASDLSNGMRVGGSELFNSLQSAEIRFFSRVQIASQDCSTKSFSQ